MPPDTSNRTLVLSVVAVDLVGYSLKPVAEQLLLKDHFNKVLLQAISDISVADRIILDTGDGVAMGFLGDPEDALYVAMFMHGEIDRERKDKINGAGDNGGNGIRIGINLGPVRLATGIGGHPNIIGDGINVAERIMAFAEPGQLTASRAFIQIMSKLSAHYTNLFQYAGERTDKQVRAHDIYLMGESVAAFDQAKRGVAERAAQRAGQPSYTSILPAPSASQPIAKIKPPPAKAPEAATPAPAPALVESHPALIDFLGDRNKVATTAFLLAVIAVTLAALLIYRKMAMTTRADSAPVVTAPSPVSASKDSSVPAISPPPEPAVIAVAPAKAASTKADPKPSASTAPATAPPAATKPAAAPVVPAKPVTPAASAAMEKPGATPAKTGERTPPAAAPVVDATRDKSKDAKVEKTERDRPGKAAAREDTRKTSPPRAAADREKTAPVSSAPFVPAYQSPTEAVRPESVAPTPAPPPPAAPRVDTSVVIVTRSDPSYPVEGIRQGILKQVVVKARLAIDAGGSVTDVTILEGGPIAAFGRETRSTLKQWKFNPGAPGRSFDIEITFKP